jgi:hypothetical protein
MMYSKISRIHLVKDNLATLVSQQAIPNHEPRIEIATYKKLED